MLSLKTAWSSTMMTRTLTAWCSPRGGCQIRDASRRRVVVADVESAAQFGDALTNAHQADPPRQLVRAADAIVGYRECDGVGCRDQAHLRSCR